VPLDPISSINGHGNPGIGTRAQLVLPVLRAP
jgi:hypothetical protein